MVSYAVRVSCSARHSGLVSVDTHAKAKRMLPDAKKFVRLKITP